MRNNIIQGVIISVIASVFIFLVINFPSRYSDQVHSIDKDVANLKGKVEILGKGTEKNIVPHQASPIVQMKRPPLDVPKIAENGSQNYWFTNLKVRDVVPRHFRVEGKMKKWPDNHLWLAVEVGGLVWPKEPEVKVDKNGRWMGEVYEGGSPPQGKFVLALYEVDMQGHQKIIEWMKNGHQHGYYQGLHTLAGGRKVAAVDLRLGS